MAGRSSLVASVAALLLFESSVAVVLHDGPDNEVFHDYMTKYNRQYQRGSAEYHQRLALFATHRLEVAAQNSKPDRLWSAELNALADRTDAELKRLRGWRGGVAPGSGTKSAGLLEQNGSIRSFLGSRDRAKPLPREFMDWTKLKAAKPTDQGGCGSCWAVTSSEVLQMHVEIHNPNATRTFSAQELVSCVPNPLECGGQGGCSGATVELAFNWAMMMGLAQEHETPYKGADTQCKKPLPKSDGLMQLAGYGNIADVASVGYHEAPRDSPSRRFGFVGFERLPENQYGALLRAVYEQGPVGISVASLPYTQVSLWEARPFTI